MREILFRAMTIKGDWVYSQTFMYKGQGRLFLLVDGHMRECRRETLTQYTGTTDKNGKRVFEGDIIDNGKKIKKVVLLDNCQRQTFEVVGNEFERRPVKACYSTEAFSRNLRRERELKGLSVRQLADKIGIDKQLIYKYEGGEGYAGTAAAYPKLDVLLALAETLEVDPDELCRD